MTGSASPPILGDVECLTLNQGRTCSSAILLQPAARPAPSRHRMPQRCAIVLDITLPTLLTLACLTLAGVAPQLAAQSAQPLTPVYRIPLRVHTAKSTLSPAELSAALTAMNAIWLSQAGICFEINTTRDDVVMTSGLDLWFKTDDADPFNGLYRGDHTIYSKDRPLLGDLKSGPPETTARSSAHELGHALRLEHYNLQPDSPDSLMSSGYLGRRLHGWEIETARQRARELALPDSASGCRPPA